MTTTVLLAISEPIQFKRIEFKDRTKTRLLVVFEKTVKGVKKVVTLRSDVCKGKSPNFSSFLARIQLDNINQEPQSTSNVLLMLQRESFLKTETIGIASISSEYLSRVHPSQSTSIRFFDPRELKGENLEKILRYTQECNCQKKSCRRFGQWMIHCVGILKTSLTSSESRSDSGL